MIRKATPADLPRIEEVMRASMSALGAHFYDDTQTASAVEHIAVIDRQLVDDQTYFVVEQPVILSREDDEGPSFAPLRTIVACGGWSARRKLFTGTGDSASDFLDPRTDAARIRAMFVLPSHARKGLGRLILESAEQDAREQGFTRFELMATLPGVPLYERCGYARVEDVTLHLPDGVTLDAVRMLK